MADRRRVFSRSIREIVDVTNLKHPLPDAVDIPKPSFSEISPYKDSGFFQCTEDMFERRDSCPSQINKREASYGSLLSILSENSSHTFSSCSLDEELDSSSAQVMAKLDRVDDVLYDGRCSENMNEKLREDCQTWTKMFPHFRIKGTSLTLHPDSLDSDLLDIEKLEEDPVPETIAEHSDSLGKITFNEENSGEEEDTALMERIQEKVLTKLVEHLLAVTLEWRAATEEENAKPLRVRTATTSRERSQLRPMTAMESHRSILPPVVPTPFRPLDGILVVSSKVLQNRRTFNYLSRPGSSVSRVKTAEQGAPQMQLLKNRLVKLTNHLENIQEGNSMSLGPELNLTLSQVSSTRVVSQDQSETRERERSFSLPPVANTNEQFKYTKKSPPVQKLAMNRNRFQGQVMTGLSRPPSAKYTFGEPIPLSYQETLPVVTEESNFLKIRPMMRSSLLNRQKGNPDHLFSARNRKM